jgi:hypothetical protein
MTPEMKTSIAKSFPDDGLFGIMRAPATIAGIRERQDAVDIVVVIPAKVELDRDRIEDGSLEQKLLEYIGAIALDDGDDYDDGDNNDDDDNDEDDENDIDSVDDDVLEHLPLSLR